MMKEIVMRFVAQVCRKDIINSEPVHSVPRIRLNTNVIVERYLIWIILA